MDSIVLYNSVGSRANSNIGVMIIVDLIVKNYNSRVSFGKYPIFRTMMNAIFCYFSVAERIDYYLYEINN